MPRSLLNHFDPKRRRTDEGDDTDYGSRLDANVNQERCLETVEDVEIREEDDVDSSIEEEELEDETEWFSRDVVTEDNLDGKDGFSEFSKLLRKAGSRELQVLFSACINRLSERGFDMFLTTYINEDFVKNVRKIWNFRKTETSVYFFCNKCGKGCERGQKICCGTESIAKFVRVGIVSQLEELVNHYFGDILDIREKLIEGSVPEHNLASHYLEHLWTSESDGALNLSGVLSIDGVNVPGQKKKIWPISLTLLDLPTSLMQLSSNILMEGILECCENPSTTLWNTIYPIINSDCNGVTGTVMNRPYTFHTVTVSADQPAKRSLFGMRSHQCANSCFYCLAPGSFFKTDGPARYEMSTEDVKRDSELGLNGFGDVPSKFLNFCLPYETPIDILHNVGEGVCEMISKELFNKDGGTKRKSELFATVNVNQLHADLSSVVLPSEFRKISQRRNGTDKTNFFRLQLFLSVLNSETLGTKARLVIIGLSLIINKMYTGGQQIDQFYEKLCFSVSKLLLSESDRYMPCKTHELLFHLPYTISMFNNVAPLATYSFESFYQFCLLGYSSKMTRGFCETACSRILLHNAVRRELMTRVDQDDSESFRDFLSLVPDIKKKKAYGRNVINSLKPEDSIVNGCSLLYSQLFLSLGTLKSEYWDTNSTDDVFFVKTNGQSLCYRFIAATLIDGDLGILAEYIIETDNTFSSLKRKVETLTGESYQHGRNILEMLCRYEGVKVGKLSGKRHILKTSTVSSIGCYVHFENSLLITAVNGVPIHN